MQAVGAPAVRQEAAVHAEAAERESAAQYAAAQAMLDMTPPGASPTPPLLAGAWEASCEEAPHADDGFDANGFVDVTATAAHGALPRSQTTHNDDARERSAFAAELGGYTMSQNGTRASALAGPLGGGAPPSWPPSPSPSSALPLAQMPASSRALSRPSAAPSAAAASALTSPLVAMTGPFQPPPRRRASTPTSCGRPAASSSTAARPPVPSAPLGAAAAGGNKNKTPPARRAKPPPAKRIKQLTLSSISKAVTAASMRSARTAAEILVSPECTAGSSGTVVERAGATAKAATAVKKASAAMAQMLIDSLEPLCVEVVESAQQMERMRADLSRLAQKVDTQGVGHERTAKAVIDLRDSKKTESPRGASSTVGCTKTAFDDKAATEADLVALAAKNNREVEVVRNDVRHVLQTLAVTTETSTLVLADSGRYKATLHSTIARLRNISADEAAEWAAGGQLLPTRIVNIKNGTKTKVKNLSVPLSATAGYLVADLKKWSLAAYFEVLGVDWPSDLAKGFAELWLEDDEFLTSEKGQAAIIAGAKALFRRGGAASRIVKSRGAGGGEHVTMTVGHYMLIGSFVRHELMVAAGLRSRQRHGKSEGAFKHWVVEVNPVKDWLPKDAAVANGMSLVDGASSRDFFYQIAGTLPPANTPDVPGSQAAASTSAGSGSSSGSQATTADAAGRLVAGAPGCGSTSNAGGGSVATRAPSPAAASTTRRCDFPAAAARGTDGGDGDSGGDDDAFGDADLFPAATAGAQKRVGSPAAHTHNRRNTLPGLGGDEDEDMGEGAGGGEVSEEEEEDGDDEYGEDDDGRQLLGAKYRCE
ncbi:hypothetical protein BU14_0183s0038 [Porphyra umbilicalis]|uniref:Uncharacterized protein n=1 Tax=Porphyra umbilicalis TaxID=2786 RepID=A0A1X6P7A2_PORUM|nr:hypothetical protein BU14_0183s0038 [Porphyra umbilicalis]|eukprot:OSX76646.1 hypothetical protein BU14_0183s0038 [Porphyra umbilicalis]